MYPNNASFIALTDGFYIPVSFIGSLELLRCPVVFPAQLPRLGKETKSMEEAAGTIWRGCKVCIHSTNIKQGKYWTKQAFSALKGQPDIKYLVIITMSSTNRKVSVSRGDSHSHCAEMLLHKKGDTRSRDINTGSGFPGGSVIICLQCRTHRFNSWVRKIPWRRAQQPTPVFLPGKFHGQRSLEGYGPWGCKDLNMTEQLTHTNTGRDTCVHLYSEVFYPLCIYAGAHVCNLPLIPMEVSTLHFIYIYIYVSNVVRIYQTILPELHKFPFAP